MTKTHGVARAYPSLSCDYSRLNFILSSSIKYESVTGQTVLAVSNSLTTVFFILAMLEIHLLYKIGWNATESGDERKIGPTLAESYA